MGKERWEREMTAGAIILEHLTIRVDVALSKGACPDSTGAPRPSTSLTFPEQTGENPP